MSLFILAIPALLGVVLAIWVSWGYSALPMDDAYILRRYAVNLALGRGWGFNPGEVSFGVTSITFPVLISIFIKISSHFTYESISYLFGILSFLGLIVLTEWWVWRETRNIPLSCLSGTLLAISPMGYMNAVSGMETMTFALGMIGVMALYRLEGMKRPLVLGILSGLVFLTRPEGLYLAAAIPGADILANLRAMKRENAGKYARFALGFAILAIPYVTIVHAYTLGWLPTTYAGKIISANPNMHRLGIFQDLELGIVYLFKGHWRCMAPFGAVGPVFWAAAAGCAALISAGIWNIKGGEKNLPAVDRKAMMIWGLLLLATIAISIFSVRPEFKIKILAVIDGIFLLAAWIALFAYLFRGGDSQIEPANNSQPSGLLALMGLTLLPFAYGALFRAGPVFGGYYNRYILPVLPALIILSMIGINELKSQLPGIVRQTVAQKITIVGFILLLVYPLYSAVRELPAHREAFRREATLNGGPRMRAAQWISRNTPPESVILVGYTGLGVVGGFAERRVLDMGALINPDIFPYYRDVPAVGQQRWKRLLKYIMDKKVDYFVTVPGLFNDPASDPSGVAGFEKSAVIEDQNMGGRFSTIIIWRINRDQIEKQG